MSDEIKDKVKEKYAEIARQSADCCGPACCESLEISSFSDGYEGKEGYVPDADLGLGCGIPTDTANIQPGDVVLDLGSGAGNDVFLAARLTGEKGRVYGVDMTEAMVAKANENKARLGLQNVEFLLGEIEDLPLPDNLADVVISNCVMNLVPDKIRAFGEVFRVLKPGGHFSISDVVVTGILPEKIKNGVEMYVGCVAGALERTEYLDIIQKAGFQNIRIEKEKVLSLPADVLSKYLSESEIKDFEASGVQVLSVTVVAEKPGCDPGCCD
ncbi:MAG: methyltransferase domain-containing protein [Bacteroidetes bacterium]|nr:MAG: methyltransferase domain-containing protein [Bacteroidota bacterium]